jgi:hypothetical protein
MRNAPLRCPNQPLRTSSTASSPQESDNFGFADPVLLFDKALSFEAHLLGRSQRRRCRPSMHPHLQNAPRLWNQLLGVPKTQLSSAGQLQRYVEFFANDFCGCAMESMINGVLDQAEAFNWQEGRPSFVNIRHGIDLTLEMEIIACCRIHHPRDTALSRALKSVEQISTFLD